MRRESIVILTLFLLIGILAIAVIKAEDSNNSNITSVNNSHENGSTSNGNASENESGINDNNETEVHIQDNGKNISVKVHAGEDVEQIRETIKASNRLGLNASNIPDNCTVTGVVIKCGVKGNRTMVVFAGNSGNIIVQVKGINASTQVQLYKGNQSIYALLNSNQTVLINYLPDQIKDLIMQRLNTTVENESINLTNEGNYSVEFRKQAKFLGLFKVREKMMKVNPQTGGILEEHAPWWGFLASDVKPETLGASCGTVTPGTNDKCCKDKGYDFWNSTSQECAFNSSA